jgi:hypothetical protein
MWHNNTAAKCSAFTAGVVTVVALRYDHATLTNHLIMLRLHEDSKTTNHPLAVDTRHVETL